MTDTGVFDVDTGLLEEDIAAARELIGRPLRLRQFNHEATIDTIRHYAEGYGDDNPLWCDEEYGARSRHGSVLAPPTWYTSVFAGVGPAFPGLQSFHGTSRWEIDRYARPGDRVVADAHLTGIRPTRGRKGGPMVIESGQVDYTTPSGEHLARMINHSVRVPRPSQGGLQYAPRQPHLYTEAELDEIEEHIFRQTRRGSEPRHVEDVAVGDVLPTIIKGPLDSETGMAYYAGNLQYGYASCDLSAKRRVLARTHPEAIPNARPLAWYTNRRWAGVGHHDDGTANAVGMPAAYDNGWCRSAWLSQAVLDWAGDDAFMRVFEAKTVAPNITADTLRITPRVTGVDGTVVRVAVEAIRQDGELSATATAEVVLPSRAAS